MPLAARTALLLALASFAAPSFTQVAPRTVAFANSNPEGSPPSGAAWSPDGTRLTFLADDDKIGQPGDLIQIDARTGKASVLAKASDLASFTAPEISEKDRDHRARYAAPDFLWSSDSKHLLLDKNGRLWLYNIADHTGLLVVDTGSTSGDDPKFSPDARYVSYLHNNNLAIHSTSTAANVTLTASTSDTILNGGTDWVYLEELDVRSNYFWSPDSRAIAYLQADESHVPLFPLTDWIPTHATIDHQRYPQPGDPNPTVRVGVVSIPTGDTTPQTRFIDLPFSPGNDYIPRFGWVDANTLYIQVLTRDHQHLNLYFADAHTGASRLVYTDTDPKFLSFDHEIDLLPNGRLLTTSWRDGHTHLYLYTFDEKHPLNKPLTLDRQLTHGDFEVESVPTVDAKSKTIFFVSTEGSPLENNLWSIHFDGSAKQKLTATSGVHDVLVSPDGAHFSDIASTASTPPVASLCAVSQKAMQSCTPFWKSTPVAPATDVTTKAVTFTAADGKTTLYGTFTFPAAASANHSVPIILNPYGGPTPTAEARNDWSDGQYFNQLLAQHGFAVLAVDNRGMGGRGRDFLQTAWHDFGPPQFADQIAALDQLLAANPQLDPKRVGWWGWSWGGSFTLYAMTHTDRIKAGLAVAPVTDWRNYDSIYTERFLGLPAANPDIYRADSPITSAAQLKGRLLIAHGTGDDNVHIANTIQFIQPLIDNGIPYDLQLFPRKTHSIAGPESRDELFNRILAHFETYLK